MKTFFDENSDIFIKSGVILNYLREELGMTLDQVSMKLLELGEGIVDKSIISRTEKGKNKKYENVNRCSLVFGLKGYDIFKFVDKLDSKEIDVKEIKKHEGESVKWIKNTVSKN